MWNRLPYMKSIEISDHNWCDVKFKFCTTLVLLQYELWVHTLFSYSKCTWCWILVIIYPSHFDWSFQSPLNDPNHIPCIQFGNFSLIFTFGSKWKNNKCLLSISTWTNSWWLLGMKTKLFFLDLSGNKQHCIIVHFFPIICCWHASSPTHINNIWPSSSV